MGSFGDYLQCCWENKVLFSGYLGMTTSVFANMIPGSENIYVPSNFWTTHISCGELLFISSAFVSAAADFGRATFLSYKKANRDIKEKNEISPDYLERVSGHYCNRKGINLALKENGLEEIF